MLLCKRTWYHLETICENNFWYVIDRICNAELPGPCMQVRLKVTWLWYRLLLFLSKSITYKYKIQGSNYS